MPPPTWRAMARSAPRSAVMRSLSAMFWSARTMSSSPISRKGKRWQRDWIVSGTLWSSVVARMKNACGGGSSRVLRSALNASFVIMCTSSMMYTLAEATTGVNCTFSLSSRMSSIWRFVAASISMRSTKDPSSALLMICFWMFSSFTSRMRRIFARILATEVLPVPRGPKKRYACTS